MKIIDCITYFNEPLLFDIRLNILNEHVDYFVISESNKTHQGKDKKINFNINNFSKFRDKIIFIVAEYDQEINFQKHTGGESPIEQHQRNSLIKGLKDAQQDDLIILSDSDEIPDLKRLSEIKKGKKFIAFSQKSLLRRKNCRLYGELQKNLINKPKIKYIKFDIVL